MEESVIKDCRCVVFVDHYGELVPCAWGVNPVPVCTEALRVHSWERVFAVTREVDLCER